MKFQMTAKQIETLNAMVDVYLKSSGINGYQATATLLDAFKAPEKVGEDLFQFELSEATLQVLNLVVDASLKSLGLKVFAGASEMIEVFNNPVVEEVKEEKTEEKK